MIIPLLALFSFILPIITETYKKSLLLIFLAVLIILIHQVFSLGNIYLFTSTATSSDNLEFHRNATNFALSFHPYYWSIGTDFFSQLIGTFYRAFGASRLLGAEIVILIFSLTLIALAKLFTRINNREAGFWLALALFAYSPTYIVYSSIIMREPFEIFFLMLSCYFATRFLSSGFNLIALLLSILFILFMGLFHKALLLYAFVFIVMLLVVKLLAHSRILRKLTFWLVLFAIALTVLLCLPPLNHWASSHLTPKIESALHPLLFFREVSTTMIFQGGSYYNVHLDFSSFFTMVSSMLNNYLHYLFAPFPWQITGLKALYASVEGLLRLLLLALSFLQLYKAKGERRTVYSFLLLVYFSLTFLWALGTLNYGTGLRHSLLTNWITIVIAAPILTDLIANLFSRKKQVIKDS